MMIEESCEHVTDKEMKGMYLKISVSLGAAGPIYKKRKV